MLIDRLIGAENTYRIGRALSILFTAALWVFVPIVVILFVYMVLHPTISAGRDGWEWGAEP